MPKIAQVKARELVKLVLNLDLSLGAKVVAMQFIHTVIAEKHRYLFTPQTLLVLDC